MDKRDKKDNLILYPGLVKRLIEKGMDALKDKNGQAALEFFLEAETYDEANPQVTFGKMLSLIELGRLNEALKQSKELLHGGTGDYYEILQVHISLLVQLGHYNEVVQLLEAVITEEKLPSQYAESFYQLLHFSRQMVSGQQWSNSREDESISDTVKPMLEAESIELQASAITMLKDSDAKDAISLLIAYINEDNRDPVLVSLAIQALKDKGLNQIVTYQRGKETKQTNPNEIDQDGLETFQRAIVAKLEDLVENEDPVLLDIAKQLCVTYMLSIYPLFPEPKDERVWACVFYACAAERIGLECQEVIHFEEIDQKLLIQKVEEVMDIESADYRL
ncbi:hypothetical protein [Bacillus sp. JCM 19034]|uniref:hypothetical protein n=1 Tax=Bacillus sp. JCM 19034 TaxID=1481928 RepID=UPI000783D9CD|nr:hypothetical protein [Bacillus sp. JCM 19034]